MLLALVLSVLAASAMAARVLIATHGYDGPVRSGGIATFSAALADVLKVGNRPNTRSCRHRSLHLPVEA